MPEFEVSPKVVMSPEWKLEVSIRVKVACPTSMLEALEDTKLTFLFLMYKILGLDINGLINEFGLINHIGLNIRLTSIWTWERSP